jgi:surface polysaccharide O-acyltransferase-like enzyme
MDRTKTPHVGRNSWIEILRLFLMFLIIVYHSYVHGSGYSLNSFSYTDVFGVIYSSLGRFAVLVFFLISGYFSSSETLNITKVLRLVLEVLFYIALWSIVLTLTKEITWDYMTFRNLFTNYWFINVYLFVMVLSPFYVKLANILTRKQFIFLFLAITFLSEFLIHFLKNSYSELLYCSLGFLVGYYLKKYGLRINYKWRLGGILSFIFAIGFRFLLLYTNGIYDMHYDSTMLTELSSPFMMIAGMALLLEFVSFEPFVSPLLNSLASGVFGVYLIHDFYPTYHLFWQRMFFMVEHIQMGYGWIYAPFLGVFIIFLGLFFDYARRYLFEKPLFYLLTKPLMVLQTKIDGILLPKEEMTR